MKNQGTTIYPTPAPEPSSPEIPEHIRSDLDDAKRSMTVACWRAAAVMARRAMQSAALEKGAKKGHLVNQIDQLATEAKITADLKKWAHEVRLVGNDAAHPGGEQVTEEDAKDILVLADDFLKAVFVTPALAERRRKKRQSSK